MGHTSTVSLIAPDGTELDISGLVTSALIDIRPGDINRANLEFLSDDLNVLAYLDAKRLDQLIDAGKIAQKIRDSRDK